MPFRILTILVALTLLAQAFAPAWAGMASVPEAVVAEAAANPPCHGAAAASEIPATPAEMPCCGTDDCRCLMGCGAAPALAPRSAVPLAHAGPSFERRIVAPQPRPAHPLRLLRPPTVLRES